ncbi:hypothetical protein [Fortiea sp. LEGE XX443]|nr:hypothetical protein [Fortiea sp. LEGE XX443]
MDLFSVSRNCDPSAYWCDYDCQYGAIVVRAASRREDVAEGIA